MPIYLRAAIPAVLLFCFLAPSTVNAVPAPPVAADANGDPLPAGAIARLGTLRLRHTCVALAWAPDGQTLASAGWDGAIRIWDAASGKQIRQCRGWMNVNSQALTYLPDGKTLASKGNQNTLHIWDAATGREVRTLVPAQLQVGMLAPGAEDGTLLELGIDSTLHVWDLATGRESSRLEFSPGKQQAHIALSADGKRVAGWRLPDELTVWDAAAGKELFHTGTKLTNLVSLTFSRDGKTVAASGSPGQIVVWDGESGKELHRFTNPGFLQWLTFSPDGENIAGLGGDRAVHLWSLAAGTELRRFEAPASCGAAWWGPGALAFSPDGKTLAASQGAAIHFWSVETGKMLQRFTGHTMAVEDVRFSADGARVASCGKDGMARLWDVSTAKETASWTNTNGSAFSMVAAPDGETVLAATPGGWMRIKLGEDKAKEAFTPGGAPVVAWSANFVLSGDGKTLLGTGQDRSIHIWDMETGKERGRLPVPPNPFVISALSPDGKFLATGGGNAQVRLWDLVAAKEVRSFGEALAPGQYQDTVGLTFSPDGWSLLEVGSGKLTLYEVGTGHERMQIVRPSGPYGRSLNSADGGLARAIFSPDCETIAAATMGGTIVLFDAANGREMTRLTGHTNVVTSMAFASDGKMLATGDVDGTVLVWDVKAWTAPTLSATAEFKPERLTALWDGLADADACKAYKAIVALAANPKLSAPYLKGKLTEAAKVPVEVRSRRALEALERAGSADAIGVLEDLTKADTDAAVKREAKAALVRLAHRNAAH